MTSKPIAAGKSSYDLVDADKVFSQLSLGPDTVLLDAACGTGLYSLAARDQIGNTGRIVSVDLWEEGIQQLNREIKARQIPNIETAVADMSKRIPIEDASVDVCLMATVLHDLIEDRTEKGTLEEVGRVLKPEGKLAIIEFKKIAGPPGPPIHIRISPEETDRHLRPYSFLRVTTNDVGPYTYFAVYSRQSAQGER